MSSSDYEKMSDVELRSKLKANGYDLPISINRDFLVRKLQQVEGHTTSSGRSLSVSNGSKKKRLSLNGESVFILYLTKYMFYIIFLYYMNILISFQCLHSQYRLTHARLDILSPQINHHQLNRQNLNRYQRRQHHRGVIRNQLHRDKQQNHSLHLCRHLLLLKLRNQKHQVICMSKKFPLRTSM